MVLPAQRGHAGAAGGDTAGGDVTRPAAGFPGPDGLGAGGRGHGTTDSGSGAGPDRLL